MFGFQDAHGDQFGQVHRDKSQDYSLIVGYQYQDTTVLRFTRKLETCDTEDLSITVSSLSPYFNCNFVVVDAMNVRKFVDNLVIMKCFFLLTE